MGYVYISYSHKDKPFVERLSHDLQAEGVSVWIDYQAIQPGEDWQSMIDRAIKGADAMLFVSSANSVMRAYITVEVGLAQANQIPVIVLIVDEDGLAKMPRSAQGLRRLDFRRHQCLANSAVLHLRRVRVAFRRTCPPSNGLRRVGIPSVSFSARQFPNPERAGYPAETSRVVNRENAVSGLFCA